MEKYSFKGIMAVMAGAVLSLTFVAQASAMAPSLSLSNNGSGIFGTTVYADPNASVVLDYYSNGQLMGAGIIGYTNNAGYFTGTLNAGLYSIPSGAQVVVLVNGQQSLPAIWPTSAYYNNQNQYSSYSYNTVTPILSQTSISLSGGQSQSITITNGYNYGYNSGIQYYVANNANSIVSATVSGNIVTVYGQNAGTASISICANGTSGYNNNCANLYVNVIGSTYYNNNNGYYNNPPYYTQPTPTYPTSGYYPPTNYYNNAPLSVSNSNVQVTVGNSGTVVIYGNNTNGVYNQYPYNNGVYPYNTGTYYNPSGNFYVSNNNNGIVNATISGNTLTVYGISAGSTTVTVCDSTSGQCANVSVVVIAPNYYNYTNGQYIPSRNGQWYYSNSQRKWCHR